MIVDQTESTIVASFGSAARGALWVCDTASRRTRAVQLSDARYLNLHPGANDFFGVVHHFDDRPIELTAHQLPAVERPLSRIALADGRPVFEGETTVWEYLPRAYTAFYRWRAVLSDFVLLLVDHRQRMVDIQQFEWYDESYDKDWQGIVGVTEMPGRDLVVVSVQRDSNPVLYDPRQRRMVGKIALAGRSGNAALHVRKKAPELWAVDYDTVVQLDASDWSIKNTTRLQGAPEGTMHFVGELAFDLNEAFCAVARPFSGDVAVLDTRDLRLTSLVPTGGQPLSVALLSDGRVFARAWKTGDLLPY
jgi:hypothetical protein